MTPADRQALKGAASVEARVKVMLGVWRRMRATVRVGCCYTPATLRAMSWDEMRDAWGDVMRVKSFEF